MCYLLTKKRWELTTTSTHTCHKTSRTQNTHQCISSKYKINDIKFWRVPIHGQRIEIRHHRPTQNMVKERQTSFRICQFTKLQILLQKQRWEKRWWCRRIYKTITYKIRNDIISWPSGHLWIETNVKEKNRPIWLELSTNLVPKMLRMR